jgi:hypothetical protein
MGSWDWLVRRIELAFSRNALKGFLGVFDAILKVCAVGGKQFHDFVGAVWNHVPDQAGGEQNGLANAVLVLFHAFLLERTTILLFFEGHTPPATANIARNVVCRKKSCFLPEFALLRCELT